MKIKNQKKKAILNQIPTYQIETKKRKNSGKFSDCGTIENFQNGLVNEIRRGQKYHLALLIESEYKANLGETTTKI